MIKKGKMPLEEIAEYLPLFSLSVFFLVPGLALSFMERQGSGLNKIREAYENAANYGEGMESVFYSDRVMFMVTLKNLNYKMLINEAENEAESEAKSEAENIEKFVSC